MRAWQISAVSSAVIVGISCSGGADRAIVVSEADLAAVHRMVVTFDEIAAAEDVDRFLTYVSDDAVMLVPNEPAVVGSDAIREWYTTFYEQFDIDGHHSPGDVYTAGDVIIHCGNATGTITPQAGGDPIPFDNKYLMVIVRQPGGGLKVWRVSYNTNLPAVAGE